MMRMNSVHFVVLLLVVLLSLTSCGILAADSSSLKTSRWIQQKHRTTSLLLAVKPTIWKDFEKKRHEQLSNVVHRPEKFTSTDVLFEIRGGSGGDVDVYSDEAYGWCVDLGSPAALIAGAVIAILYENARGGQLELRKNDSSYVKFAKKMTSLLLLSAFALEIIAIFVTTVTGTMMRSTDFSVMRTKSHNALEFMREKFEFEYLTARLSFLQGLLNWLSAVAIEFTIPSPTEGRVAPKMDQFVAISLMTLILMLISFYNKHLTDYDNYFKMISRWLYVGAHKFFTVGPMALLYIPGMILSVYYGILAFREEKFSDEDDK